MPVKFPRPLFHLPRFLHFTTTITQEPTMSNIDENGPSADVSELGSADTDEAQLVITLRGHAEQTYAG